MQRALVTAGVALLLFGCPDSQGSVQKFCTLRPEVCAPDAAAPLDAGVNPDAGGTPDGGAGSDGGVAAPLGLCNPAGWCWDLYAPQGNTLQGVWLSPATLWAVGQEGTVLRSLPGGGWSLLPVPANVSLTGVSGSADDDVWVSSAVGLFHWDGGIWALAMDAGGLTGVTLLDAGSGWAVGSSGQILKWNGATWLAVDAGASASFTGVASSADDDVWAVGGATALHFDGGQWAAVPPPAQSALAGVSTLGAAGAWAVGAGGELLSWNAAAPAGWTALDSGTTGNLTAVLAIPSGDVWAVGAGGTILRVDAGVSRAVQLDIFRSFEALAARAPDDAWAVGGQGLMSHWNGSSWSPPTPGRVGFFSSVWSSRPSDVWIVDSFFGQMMHFDGAVWTSSLFPRRVAHLTGSSANDVWAVGQGGAIQHWDGASWSPADAGVTVDLAGAVSIAANDVWAVGAGGAAVHFDGSGWSPHSTFAGADLRAVAASDTANVWAVGAGGTARRWSGTGAWAVADVDAGALVAVWTYGPTDTWVGGAGVLSHWDGGSWSPSYSTADVTALWGGGPADLWATVGGGDTLYWDGGNWSAVPSPAGDLRAIWGAGGVVWATGSNAVVRRGR